MAHAVEIENLTKSYRKLRALNNINLSVPEGAIYGLVGPNGAGKTTLIKTLVGALRPTTGTVKVWGLDPFRDKWELRKQIGYMPQAPALYDDLSAKDNISFFGAAHKVPDLAERTGEVLRFTELTNRANDRVRTFSGGMKKRVSLCCALIHRPRIVFLDEPTAAIDPHLKIQSWKLFRELAKTGVTLFISTHLMDEALLCDKVTILGNGELIAVDTPDKILERGKTIVKFLENGEVKERVVDSTSMQLAETLHQLGLNKNIGSISFHPDNMERIVLDIIREKESPGPKQ